MSEHAELRFELTVEQRLKIYEVLMNVKSVDDERALFTKICKYGSLKYSYVTWETSLWGYTVPKSVKHLIFVDLKRDKDFRIMLKQFANEIESSITYQLA